MRKHQVKRLFNSVWVGRAWGVLLILALTTSWAGVSFAAKKSAPAKTPVPVNDEEYGKKIKEFTTEPRFLTELVDHLPASPKTGPVAGATQPDKFLGYVIGTPKKLTHVKEINAYMRELERTAPKRVKVFSIGQSEEGREMIAVVVSSEENIANLERLREINHKLSDPRKIAEEEALKLIPEGKAVYYATGAMHSPETGSPEMLMELCYRLAVEETPFIQAIRKNVVFIATPVLEVDGRDRYVDIYNYRTDNPDKQAPSLIYWGKYVAHDNNRDAMVLTLNLTNNILKSFHHWKGLVLHDLHESVPYLYTSTGTGPYNYSLDPIQINEWQTLAYQEVTEMTKRGLPGVWTHGFYDGWVPNYMFYIANGRNAIGRFYETFGNGGADTMERTLPPTNTSREWYRPNPPLPRVQWSIRNNINYQQSALLFAMKYVSENKDTFLHNYWVKSKNAVERVKKGGYPAWVFTADQPRQGDLAKLTNLLRKQGIEVHRLDKEVEVKEGRFPVGSYVVRMDQPSSNFVDMLLGVQSYRTTDPNPYDDTGWTLPWLMNIKHTKVEDKKILDAAMTLLAAEVRPIGKVEGGPLVAGPVAEAVPDTLLLQYDADSNFITFRYQFRQVKMLAAEEPFKIGDKEYPAGTILIPYANLSTETKQQLTATLRDMGYRAQEVSAPKVKSHELRAPRIALMHTWLNTEKEGWVRIELDRYSVPYTYLSDQKFRDMPNPRAQFDVILFPHVGANSQTLVNGLPRFGKNPVPWKPMEKYPHLGGPDTTDDMRGGMGLEGLVKLQKFLQDGGLLIVDGTNAEMPIDYGLVRGVNKIEPKELRVRGSVLKAQIVDKRSPIVYGYLDPASASSDSLAVYFSQSPILQVGGAGGFGGGFFGGGGGAPAAAPAATQQPPAGGTPAAAPPVAAAGPQAQGAQTPAQREIQRETLLNSARLIVRFADEKNVLLSGLLAAPQEIANRAAVVDCPVGAGHILMFANRPFWRAQTLGTYAMVWNAVMNFDSLGVGRQLPPQGQAGAPLGDLFELVGAEVTMGTGHAVNKQ